MMTTISPKWNTDRPQTTNKGVARRLLAMLPSTTIDRLAGNAPDRDREIWQPPADAALIRWCTELLGVRERIGMCNTGALSYSRTDLEDLRRHYAEVLEELARARPTTRGGASLWYAVADRVAAAALEPNDVIRTLEHQFLDTVTRAGRRGSSS